MSEEVCVEEIIPSNDGDIFSGRGIEVYLEHNDFLKIREVLTRIGEVEGNNLYQACYILHKRGRYIIAHYRELMNLDGNHIEITEKDVGIRNKVADLLEEWELVTFQNPDMVLEPIAKPGDFIIIPYKDKFKWNLISRYQIGVDKRPNRVHRERE